MGIPGPTRSSALHQLERIVINPSGQSQLNTGIRQIVMPGLHVKYDSFCLVGQLINCVRFHFVGQCGLLR